MAEQRSWFEPRPLWRGPTLMAVGVFAASSVATAATAGHSPASIAIAAVLAAVIGMTTITSDRRDHRSWQQLAHDVDGEPGELRAAERVVRQEPPATSPRQQRLAARIAAHRWRDLGGYWMFGVLSVMTVGLAVAGALGSSWWLLLALAAGVWAGVAWRASVHLARRRRYLHGVGLHEAR